MKTLQLNDAQVKLLSDNCIFALCDIKEFVSMGREKYELTYASYDELLQHQIEYQDILKQLS